MATMKEVGKNDDIDSSGTPEDEVSYIPEEGEPDTPEEKSDAQRIADGEIEVSTGDSEIFVAPESIHRPPKDEEKELTEEGQPPEEEKIETKESDGEEPPANKEKPKPEKEKKVEPKDKGKDAKVGKSSASAPDPVQKRINKITREKYDAQRETDKLKRENAEMRENLRRLQFENAKAVIEKEKPKSDDFENDEDYHVALGRWAARMEVHDSNKAAQGGNDEPAIEEKQGTDDPREKIINLGSETYPDFIQKVSAIPLPKEVFDAAVDSDHAHEIIYYLGLNPGIAQRLATLVQSPIRIAREIGRIESQFIEEVSEVTESLPGDDTEQSEVVENKPKPKKQPSNAPAPVKPVGASGTVAKDPNKMSLAEYYASRGYTRDGMRKES